LLEVPFPEGAMEGGDDFCLGVPNTGNCADRTDPIASPFESMVAELKTNQIRRVEAGETGGHRDR
jgi:hypothetical protein